jgi:hypothetical protein
MTFICALFLLFLFNQFSCSIGLRCVLLLFLFLTVSLVLLREKDVVVVYSASEQKKAADLLAKAKPRLGYIDLSVALRTSTYCICYFYYF